MRPRMIAEELAGSPPRISIPAGEWRIVDAAGFPFRVVSRDGALLFRATDVAAAAGVFVRNGSTLRGLAPEDAVLVPRGEAGLSPGVAVPFLTAEGARKLLRRSRRPTAFIIERWLWDVVLAPRPLSHAA